MTSVQDQFLQKTQIWNKDANDLSPWSIPVALRKNLLKEGDLISLILLSRSFLYDSRQEKERFDLFFKSKISVDLVYETVFFLVTGAAPAPFLWDAFFLSTLKSTKMRPIPVFYALLGFFLRHPSLAPLVEGIVNARNEIAGPNLGNFILLQAYLNPLLDLSPPNFPVWGEIHQKRKASFLKEISGFPPFDLNNPSSEILSLAKKNSFLGQYCPTLSTPWEIMAAPIYSVAKIEDEFTLGFLPRNSFDFQRLPAPTRKLILHHPLRRFCI